MPALAVRPAARRTKVFSVAPAAAVLQVARSRRAPAAVPKAVAPKAAERRVVARLAAVPPVAERRAVVELPVVAEPRAAVVRWAAAVQPVVAPQAACPTLVAVPLAVVRAVIPLPVVAAAVAAAVE
jgi:hypothetical protein